MFTMIMYNDATVELGHVNYIVLNWIIEEKLQNRFRINGQEVSKLDKSGKFRPFRP